jgi:hypothetical protein
MSTNEEKFRIYRSTDAGQNWFLRDSVTANISEYTDNNLQPVTQYCYRINALNCFGISGYSNMACSTTTPIGIVKTGTEIPGEFKLFQNFPNPFNPVTNIKFDIPKASFVKITIYDISGREVLRLVNHDLAAGSYVADWNASAYASGVYFYRIEARNTGSSTGDYVNEMKMVLVK